MSRRTEMLGSTIQRELMDIIMRELNDPRLMGLPSITRVKVAADLSQADVYLAVMGTPGQQTAALNALRHSAGMMRTKLTKSLSIRQVPYLKFHLDEAYRKEIEVLELLRKVEQERLEREGQQQAQAAQDQHDQQEGDDQPPAPPAADHHEPTDDGDQPRP